MALIILNPGETSGPFGGFSTDTVVGTSGAETVYIAQNGKVTLSGSFNAGNDVIEILGDAGDYTASVDGSVLVLSATTGPAAGANIRIPFGPTGTTINFDDASRVLTFADGGLTLGSQAIALTGTTEVADGPPNPDPDTEFRLTANEDNLTGTSGSDLFDGRLTTVNGLQVNTLGTGDRLNGAGGIDILDAQVTRGSTYGDGNAPIQPELNGVEIILLDALHSDLAQTNFPVSLTDLIETDNNTLVFINAEDFRGHNEIWSWTSESDLIIQDLTTILTGGGHDDARNTGDLTIGMGYTASNNHQWDASDLEVYFDPDFLLSGQANESVAYYWLLDEDGELAGGPRLDNINVDGIRFRVDGGPIITLRDPNAQFADTHPAFVAALQDELQDLIDAGIVPADTTLTLDPTITDTTFLDNGAESAPIPAIVLQTNSASVFTPVGFSQVEDAIGQYDVYGRFATEAAVTDLPVSINIALEKAGEGVADCCDGGEMIVGSMDKDNGGIEVFYVTVYGDASRPSTLARLDSTGGFLDQMYIVSDNEGFPTDTWADLVIGDTNSGMKIIDADDFFGDFQLGSDCKELPFDPCLPFDYYLEVSQSNAASYIQYYIDQADFQLSQGGIDLSLAQLVESFFTPGCERIEDLQTLTALGGGNITFFGEIDTPGEYSYSTGGGDDYIDLIVDGDALDYANSSLLIQTDGGNDTVLTRNFFSEQQEQPNQIILRNIDINTGDGNDVIRTPGNGRERIDAGSGDDAIFTGNEGAKPIWVFNVDGGQVDAGNVDAGDVPGELPGVPLLKSLIGGGTLTVAFSGAGVAGNFDAGGGVMAAGGNAGAADAMGAQFHNGYEKTVSIDVAGAPAWYGTQVDINNAIMRAINDDPVLSKLLHAYIGSNNTLVVEGCVDGFFDPTDLDIYITRPSYTQVSDIPASLLVEARQQGIINSANQYIIDPDGGGAISVGDALVDGNISGLFSAPLDDTFYNGVNTPIQLQTGSAGVAESDTRITPGTGNDLTVLSTDAFEDISNQYWTLDGQLFDSASNETIVLETDFFGNDTVMNFQTAGFDEYVPQPGGAGPTPQGGFDLLDYTSYLTSEFSTSGSVASEQRYYVILDDVSQGSAADGSSTDKTTTSDSVTLEANEVAIIDFNNVDTTTGADSFSGLTAAHIKNAILGTGGDAEDDIWGTIEEGDIAVNTTYVNTSPGAGLDQLVGNYAVAILMVQNSDNLGDYKVFKVEWDGTATPTAGNVTVTEIGKLDFGTSLDGMDEINLAGSYESTFFPGLGINAFGPDAIPFPDHTNPFT